MGELEKKIFMICPVRIATPEIDKYLTGYRDGLKDKGYKVHYPPEDTNQDDPIGLNICNENKNAIINADEVWMYYSPDSKGSVFDLGMTFMAEKPLYIINADEMLDDLNSDFQEFLFKYSYNADISWKVPLYDFLDERREEIKNSKVIKYKWKESNLNDKVGFLFDFGMAFMADKPIALTNWRKVKKTPHKSFQNVLLVLDALS